MAIIPLVQDPIRLLPSPPVFPTLPDITHSACMTDPDQTYIADSFLKIYLDPGSGKPIASRSWLAERYGLCEDFSQLLCEQVQQKVLELRITKQDALERVERGLNSTPAPLGLTKPEINWVRLRLLELLSLH